MQGVILAGGFGTRLRPLTNVTNKHLLRVDRYPMIDYSIKILIESGIDDIMIILGGESVGDMVKYLGSGKNYGVRFTYRYQDEAGGIAQAISLCEGFIQQEKFMVVLGDNVIENSTRESIEKFFNSDKKACVFLSHTDRPEEFGIIDFDENNEPVRIIEKPKDGRKEGMAVTGIYGYSADVFEFIKTLKPSQRGELEVTDINNWYLNRGELICFDLEGWWHDCGDIDALVETSRLLREK